ncbi:MAG: hypothetical protein BM556_11025 [Bacteriovorax sp. MedPE-SWde]|nr:MAG: hypothetical protein BM556_11025 [Bacteriovorax sp. MedPE-SWde]
MRIPILDEIKLTTIEMSSLRDIFLKQKVGKTPVYSDLSHLGKDRLNEVLTTIELVLKDMNIHAKFPFPYYIISQHTENISQLPTVKTYEEIPTYFKTEVKRMSNREQKLLDKIEVICSQIENENIDQRLHEYKMNILPQKFIKSLAKEGLFLETILKEINED